jgi:signal transduction histidine kinase
VHNAGFISPEVRAQMFQRSFSTKGQGRGLGMYGVRLLTGNYLGGRVECMSSRDSGTTLLVILPRYLKHRQDGKERPDAD